MGTVTCPTHRAEVLNAICGDVVVLEAEVCHGVFLKLEFHSKCCCMAQCAAAMLVEKFRCRRMEDALAFTEEDMQELFQAEIPASRRSCVFLALKCLHKLIGQAEDTR